MYQKEAELVVWPPSATIVPMSPQPGIPSWVALQQSPRPLRRPQQASRTNPAAVHCSAAKRNLSLFSLSQPKGPLQREIPPRLMLAMMRFIFQYRSVCKGETKAAL
jgi:hypothetical protein